jgi:membrane-bound lytic murein transglycosylase A
MAGHAPLAMAHDVAMPLRFTDLNGWAEDDHASALSVFRMTSGDMRGAAWQAVSEIAEALPPDRARAFFEAEFQPVLIGANALFTGYFEPEVSGSRQPTRRFRHPVYRTPPELRAGSEPWHTRREIEEGGLLAGRDLEIAWLEDPVDVFFLHVQGSGRIRLKDGAVIRLGFDARNGHPYRSVGAELVHRGHCAPEAISAQAIRDWVHRNPADGRALLQHNPSYVFFREVMLPDPDAGPIGAMGRSVTALRSVAVDPAFIPLGAPVWIEKAAGGAAALSRLMVAQDTGAAILGPRRADIFYGTGPDAGSIAGMVRDTGRMVALLPRALALVSTGASPEPRP